MKITTTERGWGGHFICAHHCMFRRNTLVLVDGAPKYVVSTVGNYRRDGKIEEIGYQRHFETMTFEAKLEGAYWDADVSEQVSEYGSPEWALKITDDNRDNIDNLANDMHEANVKALIRKIRQEGKA